MVILLEKEAEKHEVVLYTHATLWGLKGVNLLWIFRHATSKIALTEVNGIAFLGGILN